MLYGFLALLVCQLLGEVVIYTTQLPVPGPVMGMLILLIYLIIKKNTSADLRLVSEGLLKHLAFLFVPAGVGLMVHLDMIAQYWLAILLALLISTFITMLVSAGILKLMNRQSEEEA